MSSFLPKDWLERDLEELAQLAPIEWVEWTPLRGRGIALGFKREDLLHPQLGGNKLYKLHGHLRAAQTQKINHVVSFGGAWSNHLYALAAAGRDIGMTVTVVVRGERPRQLSATLCDVEAMGARLHFISRADYRRKHTEAFLKTLREELGQFYMVPEGGGDLTGARGAQALGRGLARKAVSNPFNVVCCAAGTGSTLAGLAAGVPRNVTVCGFSALKGQGHPPADSSLYASVSDLITQLGSGHSRWHLETAYHGGGYAKLPEELAQFMLQFEGETGVPLDPVYTAKTVWGIVDKARLGHWAPGTRILVLHSGGLQGRRGFEQKLQNHHYRESLGTE